NALLGLIRAPVRLLRSLFGVHGPPDSFPIDPVPFAAGSAALDEAGRMRIEEIKRVVVGHPGLELVLKAQLAPADATAMRLAERRDQLGAAPTHPEGATREKATSDRKIAETLRPLLDGTASAEERTRLEPALERAIGFPSERLRALGRTRAAAV